MCQLGVPIRLEEAFELAHPGVDLNLELFDPYSKERDEYEVLKALLDFDIVEIDYINLDDALRNQLAPIPEGSRADVSSAVGPAAPMLASGGAEWIVPHWVCGNFLLTQPSTEKTTAPGSWSGLRGYLDPSNGKPLLVDLHGTGTSGELYADAVLDLHGADAARQHLLGLTSGEAVLDEVAIARVIGLGAEMPPRFRDHVDYWHNLNQVYPEAFSKDSGAALLGYSERMYYVERELQLTVPDYYPPAFSSSRVQVSQFAFGKRSQGTPTWMDGFVIPKKARTAATDSAIVDFLAFIQTTEAYMAFIKPRKWGPASYLLPAVSAPYSNPEVLTAAPLLPRYLDVLDDSLPMDSALYAGARVAGDEVERRIDAIFLGKGTDD